MRYQRLDVDSTGGHHLESLGITEIVGKWAGRVLNEIIRWNKFSLCMAYDIRVLVYVYM